MGQSTTTGGVTTTTSYFYSGDGDTPDFTTTGPVTEHTVPLPGGVLASITRTGQTWSYPNLHGDVVITTNAAGTRQGAVAAYDPFGDPFDPQTGNIGTSTAAITFLTVCKLIPGAIGAVCSGVTTAAYLIQEDIVTPRSRRSALSLAVLFQQLSRSRRLLAGPREHPKHWRLPRG